MACYWLPHPRSAAPQSASRVGQVDLECRCKAAPCSGPYSCLAPTISGVTGWHLRQGMPGARFPVGLCTLQVIHHVIPQPSHHLLGACLPLMGPFRSHAAHLVEWSTTLRLQGLIGYLYTQRCYHILPCRFHGAQRGTSGRWKPSPGRPALGAGNGRDTVLTRLLHGPAPFYPFNSFFSSLRKRQSVPWAMIFWGARLDHLRFVEP